MSLNCHNQCVHLLLTHLHMTSNYEVPLRPFQGKGEPSWQCCLALYPLETNLETSPSNHYGSICINSMTDVLLRAAIETLNRIWLAYREMIYADQIDQIVWKGPRRLVMRTGCTERTKRRWPATTSPLMMFPGHLCKRPQDKAIVLNFLQCNVAVTHMQCILNWILKGRLHD